MNRKQSLNALCITILALCALCCTIPPIDNYVSDYVSSISVDTQTNAMRVVVKPVFKQDCTYSVKYWKAKDKELNAKQTVDIRSTDTKGALLLFLEEETEYRYRFIINGMEEQGTNTFTTIARPICFWDFELIEKYDNETIPGYILQTNTSGEAYVTLCDYNGKIVWYNVFGKNSNFAWYNPSNGLMSVYCAKDASIICADLAGNILFQGKSTADFIPDLHHDIRMLDNGNMLALSKVPKRYNNIDYYGEALTEFDTTGKIVFSWDTFGYYNPEVTPYIKYEEWRKDYLHGNSVEKDSNGDYYMTLNWLTEIIKIDGKTGKMIYRFGERGDVKMTGQTPDVYHSIQPIDKPFAEGSAVHTAIALEPDRILCLANGKDDGVSKAAVVKIDPVSKTAHYELLVDFEKRFNTADRSNVSLLPSNRVLLGSAPLDVIVIADYQGNTMRVLERRNGVSPRALWYDADQFTHYLQ